MFKVAGVRELHIMHRLQFSEFSGSKQAQGKIKSLATFQYTEVPGKCICDPNASQGEGERRERFANCYYTAGQGQKPTFPGNDLGQGSPHPFR